MPAETTIDKIYKIMLNRNYYAMQAVKIIYEANKRGVLLWLQNDVLKFKAPEDTDISDLLKKLTQHKADIITILKENKVYQNPTFQPFIYKLNAEIAPLSYNQEQLWFIEQYENGTNAYHIPIVYELMPFTEKEGIVYAIRQIIKRHTVLRSTISHIDDKATQILHDEVLTIEEEVVAGQGDMDVLIRADVNRPFDLGKEYPIRVKFFTSTDARRTILLINMHHIASDGWSLDIFKKELSVFYQAYVNKSTADAPPEPDLQYSDYAIWQKNFLRDELITGQLNYWKKKLHAYEPLQIPADYDRPAKIDYSGRQIEFTLDAAISKKLRTFTQQYGVTLNSVMLSSISILLSKYTGQNDIVLGAPVGNRHHPQTEGSIGFFVNTQVNRILLDRSGSFKDLIQWVHNDQVEAQHYQDLPFEKLVEAIETERDPSRHPVFQVMFSVERFGNQSDLPENEELFLKPYPLENAYEIEKFDLSITIDDSEDELVGQISYATSLFKNETIVRLIQHYKYLLQQLVDRPELAYTKMRLPDEREYELIVNNWNETDRSYQQHKTIHALFLEQADRTPDAIAVVYEDRQISYRELNEKSNQLAHHLRKRYKNITGSDLTADTLIPFCLDRSIEMMIGVFAIMKAGAAYVPMDISYPGERIAYVLQDTGATLVLGKRENAVNKYVPEGKRVYIDLSEEIYINEPTKNLPEYSLSGNLAYVIFTSGTTGHPKGVMIEHASVINEIQHQLLAIPLYETDRSLLTANIIFDAAAECMYMALFSGGSLHIVNTETMLDSAAISQYIQQQQITVLNTTPSYLRGVGIDLHAAYLKHIILGGEAYQKIESSARVYNTYGPTEAAIVATACEIGDHLSTHIGKPISNVKAYILDADLNPVPVGVIGELYLGGAGLARGYLNREDLTRDRFIPNPFATDKDLDKGYTRLYKTGDTVKWLADGNIEYIGRNDDQVKLRGYRIELGEIEQALAAITGIRQSCVVVKEKKNGSGTTRYLAGYYVPDAAGEKLDPVVLTEKLAKRLPEYMIPVVFVALESFPLTINGKLDKRALPEADFVLPESEYVQPASELEAELARIYGEVLGIPSQQVSVQQNFFRMGGNSILTMQLKQKINKLPAFKHIRIADLFKYNTIAKLVESIQQNIPTEYKLQQNTAHRHEMAVIGVSGAFSGVNDVEEFWNIIRFQLEGTRFYSKEECDELGLDERFGQDANFIPVGAEVRGTDLFDPLFWGMSPNEARQLDPQIRKFVEHCWLALDAAGYAKDRRKHHIGVFAGSGSNNYFHDHILHGEMAGEINVWEASNGNSKDALATKASYLLGLTGPANSINTACSTSLVAVIEACKNLRLGICDIALAGGVSLTLPGEIGYVYEEGMILSKDGHCRTFDEQSSGTVVGAGVGVVVLKTLEKAIADKDPILAVIKGYATNNDGDRKTGYTAPSVIGQSECILQAQKMAGITSDQVQYVECHGTATNLGDPIEVQALQEAFAFNRAEKAGRSSAQSPHSSGRSPHSPTTVLGAVKANIGHADSAAGIAGLIKVCSMLQHQVLPGQVNYDKANPELDLENTPFEILKANRPWTRPDHGQRIAGVSSFGIGGTNAHVIMGDYEPAQEITAAPNIAGSLNSSASPTRELIIPLSAKSRRSLDRYKKELSQLLTTQPAIPIGDLAYTLQEKREHFSCRTAHNVQTREELIEWLNGDTGFVQTNTESDDKLVFVFPGQGVQYINMGKGLYDTWPVFRTVMDRCIALANEYIPIGLADLLYPKEDRRVGNINETQWTQITLFVVEYALAVSLIQEGVQPLACIGHSIGEYVAATLAGVFELKDAIRAVVLRGKLMQQMPAGSMLAVSTDADSIRQLAAAYNCEIAVINSIEDVVVSGTKENITALKETLDGQNLSTVVLNTSHAYHSVSMEAAAQEFEKEMEKIALNRPVLPFLSNLTGGFAGAEVATAGYWSQQLRNTVNFAAAVETLSNQYNHQLRFLEVGPGKALGYFINKYRKKNNYNYIETVQLLPAEKELKGDRPASGRRGDSRGSLQAKLWMHGIITRPNEGLDGRLLAALPAYQFDHQRCWINRSASLLSGGSGELLIKRFTESIGESELLTKGKAIDLLTGLLTRRTETAKPATTTQLSIVEESYSETQLQMARVIGTILGIEQISIHDDFFKLGGNSISAIQASHRMSEVLKQEIKVADIFKYKSISSLLESVSVKEIAEGVEWEF